MRTYTNVFDLGDLKTALSEAFEIKKDRYKYESFGKHKTCLLIFFNNSLRTRLSTQKAARNLGMDVIVLDINQGAWKLETERGVVMDGDKSEHLLEAIPVMASYCDIIGVRSFARFENREDDYTEKILNQFIQYSGKPVFSMEAATGHPLQAFADLITIEEYKRKERPKVVLTWAPHPRALPQAVPNSFADFMNKTEQALNEKAKKNPIWFRSLSPSQLEKISVNSMKEVSVSTPFRPEEIKLVAGISFPDTVAVSEKGYIR